MSEIFLEKVSSWMTSCFKYNVSRTAKRLVNLKQNTPRAPRGFATCGKATEERISVGSTRQCSFGMFSLVYIYTRQRSHRSRNATFCLMWLCSCQSTEKTRSGNDRVSIGKEVVEISSLIAFAPWCARARTLTHIHEAPPPLLPPRLVKATGVDRTSPVPCYPIHTAHLAIALWGEILF